MARRESGSASRGSVRCGARGHDLCLATLVDAKNRETLLSRETDAYGGKTSRVDCRSMKARWSAVRPRRLGCGLGERAAHDHRRGLGAPSSAEHAIAAAKVSRSAFWASVELEEQEDTDDSNLEVLVAVDASVLLEASKSDDGAAVPRWAAVLARHASDSIKEPARMIASLLSPYVGRYNAESMASMASVLLMMHLIRRYFLGRSLLLVKERGAYHL